MPVITGPTGPSGPSSFFEINSLTIDNLDFYSEVDYIVSPSVHGLSSNSKLISASLLQDDVSFKLDIFDPSISKIITDSFVRSTYFSGIKVDLYDSNRNFISNVVDYTKNTNISFTSSSLKDSIQNYTGFDSINNFRTFFLDFTTCSIYGDKDTYSSLLTYPQVEITGLEVLNTNPIQIAPLLNDYSYAKSISTYLVADPNELPSGDANLYNPASGYLERDLVYQNNRSKTFFEFSPPASGATYVDYTNPFNFIFLPYDYFNTGSYFSSSGIKTSFYETEVISSSIDNITGFVSASQNKYDKNLDLKAFVKWDAIQQQENLSFEAHVSEKGSNHISYVFNSPNTQVEAIE